MTKKGKISYSANEIRTIFYMKEKGYKPREIAERLHRSTHAIEMFLNRYRKLGQDNVVAMANGKDTPNLVEALEAIPERKPAIDIVKEEQKKEDELTSLWDINTDEIMFKPAENVIEEIVEEKVEEPKQEKRSIIDELPNRIKCKKLCDYSSRELFHEIFVVRGYYIKDNDIYKEEIIRTEKKVNLKDIINNG